VVEVGAALAATLAGVKLRVWKGPVVPTYRLPLNLIAPVRVPPRLRSGEVPALPAVAVASVLKTAPVVTAALT
jgi:hypothetical protein